MRPARPCPGRGVGRKRPPGQPHRRAQILDDARRQQADQIRIPRHADVDTVEGLCRDRGPADVAQPLQQPHPQARSGQVTGRDQAVVPAANDDDIDRARPCSAEVALDLVTRAHGRLAWVAAGLAQCPTLPQQVPALVEFDLDAAQAIMLLRLGDVAVLQLRPQFFSSATKSRMCARVSLSVGLLIALVCPSSTGRSEWWVSGHGEHHAFGRVALPG